MDGIALDAAIEIPHEDSGSSVTNDNPKQFSSAYLLPSDVEERVQLEAGRAIVHLTRVANWLQTTNQQDRATEVQALIDACDAFRSGETP